MSIKVGDTFLTCKFGKVVVLEYNNSRDVVIKFLETGSNTRVSAGHLRSGLIQDNYAVTCYGVGMIGNTKTGENAKHKLAYSLWKDMLKRCYDKKYQLTHSCYSECVVSDYFKCFANFEKWCLSQTGFKVEGFRLDKDILIKGNKVYSEDTCCFVPYEINSLFIRQKSRRGIQPIGVSKVEKTGMYVAKMCYRGKYVNLGHFESAEQAFNAYKQSKESHIKEVANKWREQIDPKVYDALMSYKVEITD